MNETKSARYHRLRRRAGVIGMIGTVALLTALLAVRPALHIVPYATLLMGLYALVALPVSFYQEFLLDRRYELSSQSASAWLRRQAREFLVMMPIGLVGAWGLYRFIAMSADWWWLSATLTGAGIMLFLTRLTPALVWPMFYRCDPVERPSLKQRLLELSTRAGVPVLGVFEWRLGPETRRANAVLVGSGASRRILLSDTLLAEYSEDEIEVVLAHELAHCVHRDITKGFALETVRGAAALYTAAAALDISWTALGLSGPADPAGLPLLLLAAGTVGVVTTPIMNAVSRLNERRADRFALSLTRRGDAFVSAMRRLGAQNLVEESPSRTAVWLFHTHPPIDERIAAARVSAG